jgi:hypothetical protein
MAYRVEQGWVPSTAKSRRSREVDALRGAIAAQLRTPTLRFGGAPLTGGDARSDRSDAHCDRYNVPPWWRPGEEERRRL